MHHLSSILAAHGHARQVEATLYTDGVADAAERVVGDVWGQLLQVLRTTSNAWEAQRRAQQVLRDLLPAVQQAMRQHLERLAHWAHESAARNLLKTLPADYLLAAAQRRQRLPEGRLLEAGLLTLSLSPGGLQVADELAAVRDDESPDAETQRLLQELLFPPPSESFVRQFIARLQLGGETWEQRLQRTAARWSPAALAGIFAAGYAQGKNQRQIAQDLLPAVDGVRSSARRLARTYGMAIAHEQQQATSNALGDLVAGFQVHATLDEHTRPAHRERDGRIYWKRPEPGQHGLDEMPHPPREANGEVSWNCRCVTGDSLVHADVSQIARSWYRGEAVEFSTVGGARLTVTINHPIATPDGMVAVGDLRQGDYVLSDSRWISQRARHQQNRPAPIKDVFQSLAERFGILVLERPSFLEFHGDGRFMDGQIHIVGANLDLMGNSITARVKLHNDGDFVGRTPFAVSRDYLPGSLAFAHPRPLESFGGGSPSDLYASLNQDAAQAERSANMRPALVNAATSQTVGIRKRLQGFPGKITFHKSRRWFCSAGEASRFRFRSEFDPSLLEPDLDCLPFDSAFAAELLARHSGFIFPDKIIHVRRLQLNTSVYSVDTGLGYYMGSDNNVAIVQGNCFLTTVLTPKESIAPGGSQRSLFTAARKQLVPDPLTYSHWFSQVDERRQRLAVGSRRYSAARSVLGRQPDYAELVAPSGRLLTVAEIESETKMQRAARVAEVLREMRLLAKQKAEKSLVGFVRQPVPGLRLGR